MVGREVFWDLYQYLFFLRGKNLPVLFGSYLFLDFIQKFADIIHLKYSSLLQPVLKPVLLSDSC